MSFSCDCSIDPYDYDCPDVFNERMIKARKPHKCCECGAVIQVGDRHELVEGLWDGSWSRYRTCRACKTIRNHYCPNGSIYGGLKGQLWECLEMDYVTGFATGDDDDE